MKTNLKQKITNYLNSLSDELRSKLEYRKNKPHTPKLNKLSKFVIILFTVIYLLVGCLGGIKASAVEPPSFDISSAKEGPSLPEYNLDGSPTDLTGYTVTVPGGSSMSAGYGSYNLEGSIKVVNTDGSLSGTIPLREATDNLYIGYSYSSNSFVATIDRYSFLGNSAVYVRSSSQGFVLTISGGSDVSNSSLIQWLADNNATFVNNNAPVEPEPTTITVPAGIYYLQNIYNDLRGSIQFDKPFTTSNGEEFVSIEFAGYNNNQYTQVSYYTNPVTDAGPSPSVPKPIYNGVNGFTDISDCIIYLEVDTVIEYYDDLWDDTFVAVNSDTKLINLYNGAFNIGDAEGYDRGYTVGDADGYQEGYDDGRSDGMADGFMSNFFGGIVDALDALKLFGSVSMLDIIEGILGLMLCLWILKLIAGG